MKIRIIGGILCVLTVFSLCLFGTLSVSRSFSEMESVLQKGIGEIGQREKTEQNIMELEKIWTARKKSLGAFLKHSDADEMEEKVLSVKTAYQKGDFEEVQNKMYELKTVISVIKDGERPVIENIF